LRSQHPPRSLARRGHFLPAEDSVPLFLSGSGDEPHASKFARPRQKSSRLFKTGALAAAALIATFVAVKNPFTVFANAAASLIGTADVKSAPVAEPSLAQATPVQK